MSAAGMTDEEIICTWMEPRPRWPMTCEQAATTKFWGGPLIKNQYSPRELDLNALHHVEARLRNYGTSSKMRMAWILYGKLLPTEEPWHASAADKIKALAIVLRPVMEK